MPVGLLYTHHHTYADAHWNPFLYIKLSGAVFDCDAVSFSWGKAICMQITTNKLLIQNICIYMNKKICKDVHYVNNWAQRKKHKFSGEKTPEPFFYFFLLLIKRNISKAECVVNVIWVFHLSSLFAASYVASKAGKHSKVQAAQNASVYSWKIDLLYKKNLRSISSSLCELLRQLFKFIWGGAEKETVNNIFWFCKKLNK